jgi:hypothetical protein
MMFWGCIVSSALVGAGTGLVIFILLWQTTRVLVQKLIVLCIGLIIITLIKMLVRDLRDSPTFLCVCCDVHAFHRQPFSSLRYFRVARDKLQVLLFQGAVSDPTSRC